MHLVPRVSKQTLGWNWRTPSVLVRRLRRLRADSSLDIVALRGNEVDHSCPTAVWGIPFITSKIFSRVLSISGVAVRRTIRGTCYIR